MKNYVSALMIFGFLTSVANAGVICNAGLSNDPFSFKGMINQQNQSIGYVSTDFGSVAFDAEIKKNDEVISLKVIDFKDGRTLFVDRLIVPFEGSTKLRLLLENNNYAEVDCQKFQTLVFDLRH